MMNQETLTIDELRRKIRLGKLLIFTRQELMDAIILLQKRVDELEGDGGKADHMTDALKGIEECCLVLTENARSAILRELIAPGDRILEANSVAVEIFGYDSKDELLAANPADLYENHDERARIHEGVSSDGFFVNENIRMKRKDGTHFEASLRTVALPDSDHNFTHCMDIVDAIPEEFEKKEENAEVQLVYGTLQGAMSALQATLEILDHGSAIEQRRIARLSIAIARELGLDKEEVTGIGLAGALHDLGKIYIPQMILDNEGELSDLEYAVIKDHPEVGFNILKTVELRVPKFPWPLAEIVLQHHERLDGSGYPHGLEGDEMLLGSRIIAVADVVVAMTIDRPHRRAPGLDKALDEIRANRGKLYDPDVVDACLRLIKEERFTFD